MPKAPRTKAADEPSPAMSKLDFSRSLQKLTPETFFRFIREYPDHEATSLYVYRLEPKIDRALAGIKDSNIDVIRPDGIDQFDDDYLLRKHGSGRYHVKFSDGNKPKFLTEVAKTTVTVNDPLVPPAINPVELVVSAKENEHYIQQWINKGWTVEDGKLKAPAGADNGNAVLAETVKDLAHRMADRPAGNESPLVARLLEVIERRGGGGDQEIERALRLAERLQPPKPEVDLTTLLVTMLKRDHPAADSAARPDPIAQLKEAAAFLKEMGWGQPAAPSGPSWTEILGQLPAIVTGLATLPSLLQQLRAMQQPDKVVSITGEVVTPAPPANPAATAAPGGQDVFGQLGFGLKDLVAVGDDAIDAFERGITGQNFAHALVCRRNGEKLYDVLYEMGTDQLLAMLQMRPDLMQKLEPRRAEVVAWLKDFMAYGEEEEPSESKSAA